MAVKPVSDCEFAGLMTVLLSEDLPDTPRVLAVAVSGGPDSVALAFLLHRWAHKHRIALHVLTVDHGLRKAAAAEARAVAAHVKTWPGTTHKILRWTGRKPKTRILEEARKARYAQLAAYARKHRIAHLCLAHHQDDQAETVLLRLAGGSGLDGLTGMRAVQSYDEHLTLLRPLLGVGKTRLIATCRRHKLPYAEDPTNTAPDYARPRLRKAWTILEAEGLSAKRLAVTAMRLARARDALESFAAKAFESAVLERNKRRIVMNADLFLSLPEDIALRLLLKAAAALRDKASYAPRMEKLEDLHRDLLAAPPFRRRTLGGLIFSRDDRKGRITLETEK